MLDLAYTEDSRAEVDMNVAMTSHGELVEVQGTAEGTRSRAPSSTRCSPWPTAASDELFDAQPAPSMPGEPSLV